MTTDTLFDPQLYETPELKLPPIDDQPIMGIAAKFSGTVRLERGNPDHVQFIRESRFGETRILTVEALVGPPVPDYRQANGEIVDVTLTRSFTITRIYNEAE